MPTKSTKPSADTLNGCSQAFEAPVYTVPHPSVSSQQEGEKRRWAIPFCPHLLANNLSGSNSFPGVRLDPLRGFNHNNARARLLRCELKALGSTVTCRSSTLTMKLNRFAGNPILSPHP
ncbi:MAG TPA: hypothetical protein VI136_05985, partial [Verrucomicrobiae bacterium]